MKSTTILMFPGQGSQAPGMAEGWLSGTVARQVLAELSDAVGQDVGLLMAPEADPATLTRTENAQLALLAVGLMAVAELQDATQKPLKDITKYVAGHSLGEYTAVAAAGGLSVTGAAQLVQVRGGAMAQAAPGGMSAVLGLAPASLADVLAGQANVWLANDNCEGQAVISGTLEALPAAEEALKAAGAKRVLRLPVGGAFHTPLQTAAREAVAAWLAARPVAPLNLPCVMNFTAQNHENEQEIQENLIQQITGQVRWREAMQHAAAQGVTEALELGCGKVLAGLAPRCDSRLQAVSLTGREALLRYLETVL